ncbi:hypothetical protein [Nocardia sp. AG03]|uniref:hypothetical protein n=1 Tax=Nocardia sp. AG03 TaxID=3025312 RepID=UPI002418A6C1|nr:hypothetical protein [Nocardia sp. AG03]
MSDKFTMSLDLMKLAAVRNDETATHLNNAKSKIAKVEIGDMQAGTFALALEKYRTVPSYVGDRMTEGATVMSDIADVLRHVRDTFEAENKDIADSFGALEADI